MSDAWKVKNTDAVILCGGKGKRLQPLVHDRPKALAEIGGEVFLDILLGFLLRSGFRRFILCTGYMGELIKEHYKRRRFTEGQILFSHEASPLGTGGGLKNAEALIKSDPFLVLNGDSFCKINFADFLRRHHAQKAAFSLALARTKVPSDYGAVRLSKTGEIISFKEKHTARAGRLVSAGAYLFTRGAFALIPKGENSSLERDLFPRLIGRGFYGYLTRGSFLDIGTPERYRSAAGILRRKLGKQ